MALTALNAALRLTEVKVELIEETGLWNLRYNGEVAIGFETVPVTSAFEGVSSTDITAEASHSALIEDLNDQAADLLA